MRRSSLIIVRQAKLRGEGCWRHTIHYEIHAMYMLIAKPYSPNGNIQVITTLNPQCLIHIDFMLVHVDTMSGGLGGWWWNSYNHDRKERLWGRDKKYQLCICWPAYSNTQRVTRIQACRFVNELSFCNTCGLHLLEEEQRWVTRDGFSLCLPLFRASLLNFEPFSKTRLQMG